MKIVSVGYLKTGVSCPTCLSLLEIRTDEIIPLREGGGFVVCPLCQNNIKITQSRILAFLEKARAHRRGLATTKEELE